VALTSGRPEVPADAGYGLAREGEDLDALMRGVGARRVFGLSSGATIALYTAIHFPGIEQAALYEPPLTIDGADPASWVPAFERALLAGNRALALTEILKGTAGGEYVARLPRFVLVPLLRMVIGIEAKIVSGDDIALRDLIPTMRLDSIVQRESVTMVHPRISELRSDVLLLGGEKSPDALQRALQSVAQRLPSARRVELQGVGHVAADNRGAPGKVARLLDEFFST
jgi:pimeloyl-ACP methyl ester carboxylesterase